MEVKDSRRERIEKLINLMGMKNKNIETVDKLLTCARELYPYLPDQVVHGYAVAALRMIKNPTQGKKPVMVHVKNGYGQSTLQDFRLQQ